jgi:hypothetical protein
MKFEWNQEKAKNNLSKHKDSFEEAKTVFEDPFFIDFYDPDHSDEEDRFIIVGQSVQDRLLILSYTERSNSIRIISAREVTQKKDDYEKGRD